MEGDTIMSEKKYSDELFDAICNTIATSNKGLKHICNDLGVSTVTFYKWLQEDENNPEKPLINKYARAREMQADYLADEMIEIADDGTNDTLVIETPSGSKEIENKEWTNRSKLRVETRKWIAMKLKPKKYGDKLDLTSGGEKLPPAQQTITIFKLPDNGRDEAGKAD